MIECQNLIKEFGVPPQRILHSLNFEVKDREFLSISGRSGSGKSTLLYLLSTLDLPTRGTVKIDGRDVAKMSSDEIHLFRNEQVGFVFQFHYLLPELSAIENVLLPARNLGCESERQQRAKALLDQLGIGRHANKFPSQMSGGEQQRVAIARALVMDPKYLFADEPTGNLDSQNGQVVMDILKHTNQTLGTTIILVTHEPDYAAMASREIYLVDGYIGKREETINL